MGFSRVISARLGKPPLSGLAFADFLENPDSILVEESKGEKLHFGGFWSFDTPPPYQPAPAGDLGDRGDQGFGSWNLGSGDHPGRAIWESNLGRGSWNLGAGEHPGRAIWESNLG